MAITYVNDLRLSEMGTGDNSGTWGTVTNTNLELIGEAFGFGTEAITTNADTHTSTIADGATDPVRAMYVKYTGTLDSTCTITIGPNTVNKFYYIENGTSGSQDIVISQGSGANVTIPAGDVKAVYLDGAGSGAAVTDAFASLNIGSFTSGASTITVADNSTVLSLVSTDADADTGPKLDLTRNSASPAANDILGQIRFMGEDAADNSLSYVSMFAQLLDPTDGGEDGSFELDVRLAGSNRSRMISNATETVFNDDGQDINFRIETDAQASAFVIDAADDTITMTNQVVTITHGGNGKQLELVSTDADGSSGPQLDLFRNSASPADADYAGVVAFRGKNSADEEVNYANINLQLGDVTDGTEDGTLSIQTIVGGTVRDRVNFRSSGTVFNDESQDIDFRIESDGNANMLFVDGGQNKIGIGSSSFNYGSALTVHANDDGGTPSSVFLRNSGTSGGSGARLEAGYVTGYGAAIRFSGNPSSYRMYGTYFERITGDGPTYATSGEFGTTGIFKTYEGVVHNENGGDKDFRVEGDSHTHALYVDASTDRVGINRSVPTELLHLGDTNPVIIKLECTDTTLSSDQVLGALQWRSNDPSGIGVADVGQIAVRSDSSTGGSYYMQFNISSSSVANYEALRINRVGDVTTTGQDFDRDVAGFTARRGDSVSITRTNGTALEINRSNDGDIVNFRSAGTIEGTISISGSTTSYNGFAGRHESSGIPLDTEIGTVVSTIDELDIYPEASRKAGQTRADHAKIKVSDSVGDTRVYGVVSQIDDQNKTFVTSVGIGSVKVTGACQGGDLLESNGDGTAKVQSDDIIRSKTLGKVTIGNSDTGVKLVSCVMYCG